MDIRNRNLESNKVTQTKKKQKKRMQSTIKYQRLEVHVIRSPSNEVISYKLKHYIQS